MKNRFAKIILIVIISFNIFPHLLSDEFNFNVTELQISKNGNLIKGINGGTVTTDNNIVITADNFEYNKLTLLLKANGRVKLIDKNENITIQSNEIFYEKDKELIYTRGKSTATNSVNIDIFADKYFKYNKLTSLLEANGNVLIEDSEEEIVIETNEFFYLQKKDRFFTKGKTKIFIENKYIINTKDLIFLRNQKLLSSQKKTSLKDIALDNIYKLNDFEYSLNQEILKGNKIQVITSNKEKKSDTFFFENGFIDLKENKFLAKDVNVKFHKSLFDNEKNDPRINALIGYGNESNTYFEKGVFTSCKKTDKCPPWKIVSHKIRHDKKRKQIIYKDAWVKIYDFPVVYFPWFFHPDPTVKRQSGFLKPELGSSETLGDSIYTPYFYVISDNKDITIKPRLFNEKKFVIQNEYRQKTKNSSTLTDFSFTKGHASWLNGKTDSRSHFFSNTIVDLKLEEYTKSLLEINYEKTSNDNYLKLFNLESPLLIGDNSVLESKIKLDLTHENYDLTTSVEMYETLSGSNSDRYEYVLPAYGFSKNFNLENLDGNFNFSSSGNNTLSSTNVGTSTLSNDLNYSTSNFYFDNGITSNFEVFLKNINSIGKNSPQYKTSPQSEIMSAYAYNASYPLIKNTKRSLNVLEPKLSFRFSPHEMKNNKNVSRRIDASNVFNTNRLSINNSFEGGESITLGLDYKKEKVTTKNEIKEIEEYFDFKLAAVFRLEEEENIPTNSTINKKTSNIFGQFDYKPIKNVSLYYNFSLNNDLNYLEYNSINAKVEFDHITTTFNFIEERGIVGNTNMIENTTLFNFNEENTLSFNTRRNRKLNLTEYYDLVYEYKNDCLIAGLKYKKKYYNDADIKPLEELFFSITIIPLTTFSPDKMVLNKN